MYMVLFEPLDESAPQSLYLRVGYIWQQGPDDLHIQFDGPGADNFWPKEENERYVVKHRGKKLAYKTLGFQAKLSPDEKHLPLSEVLDKTEVENYWSSPNRVESK